MKVSVKFPELPEKVPPTIRVGAAIAGPPNASTGVSVFVISRRSRLPALLVERPEIAIWLSWFVIVKRRLSVTAWKRRRYVTSVKSTRSCSVLTVAASPGSSSFIFRVLPRADWGMETVWVKKFRPDQHAAVDREGTPFNSTTVR